MVKRVSSLALVLLMAGSVFAAAARVRDEHACASDGTEMMSGMETMPCCEEQVSAPILERDDPAECCIVIPQLPGSSGVTIRLTPPSFSITVAHPAIVQSPLITPRGRERPSTQIFLPNFQSTYIRKLSLLI